ncbi:MAG TPA: DUF4344 domain-containing metallopeptidase [Longimicrobium sp.]|nr:DUF4344 domain-containing metallopeptidase [Longimicrobium sp.]
MRTSLLAAGALAALALASSPAAAAAQGRWVAAYPAVRNPDYVGLQQNFAQQNPLRNMVDPLNEYFPVPTEVTVEMAECGRAGAFYDHTRPAVQLCYELFARLAEALIDKESGDDERFIGAFGLILLHQVGHAFIDQMELPVDVPIEEAADQFVAVMVGNGGGELQTVASGVLALNEMQTDWENPASGYPALRGRRLQNLLCLLYGTDPGAHQWLVEDGHLPAARAAGCPAHYQEVSAGWENMLEEHVQG